MISGAPFTVAACLLCATAPLGLLRATEAQTRWQLVLAMDLAGGGAIDIFLDTSSIRRHGNITTVVENFVHTNPELKA